MNIVKNNNKRSTLINLQNNTDVLSRYGCNGNTLCTPSWSCVRAQVHMFIYRSYRSIYKFHGDLISTHTKRVVAKWRERWTCNLEAVLVVRTLP